MRLTPRRPLLMLVTEPHPRLAEIVEEAIAGGVDVIQWRGTAPERPIPRSFLASPSPASGLKPGEGVSNNRNLDEGYAESPPQPLPEGEGLGIKRVGRRSLLAPGCSGIKCRTNPFPLGEGGDAVVAPGRVPSARLAAGGEVSRGEVPLHLINAATLIALPPWASGIHLPERAGKVSDTRERYGTDLVIGRSIHSVDSARQAEADGADYVIAGTIFASNSHPGETPAGLGFLQEVCRAMTIPVIAIGGVTPDSAGECLRAGAAGVAVLSPIIRSEKPGEMAAIYRAALDGAAGKCTEEGKS